MIYYRPTDGDAHTVPVFCRPRTCFLMTQLGEPLPHDLDQLRSDTEAVLIGEGSDYGRSVDMLLVSFLE